MTFRISIKKISKNTSIGKRDYEAGFRLYLLVVDQYTAESFLHSLNSDTIREILLRGHFTASQHDTLVFDKPTLQKIKKLYLES